MRTSFLIIFTSALLFLSACVSPQIKLFSGATDPLQEFTLEGEGRGKILLVSVKGIISDTSEKEFLHEKPSMVQEIIAQLRKAEKDDEIKAVILKISSPGGTVTASDILYNEIMAFKKRTNAKVVAAMMDIAASGGYYISLPADFIMAHPTTVTGSVGVIFVRPKMKDLMGKIGLGIEVNKWGQKKDMGSPFRDTTQAERKILQDIVDGLGQRFISLVTKYRNPNQRALSDISSARVYLAEEAKNVGLIDEIGYLNDAISKAKSLTGLPEDARLVVYRRTEYPDDTLYNTSMKYDGKGFSLIDSGLPKSVTSLSAGFYYLWLPAFY